METNIENPYYDYNTTTQEAEQIETLHDTQNIFHDTQQRVNELLEPTQQNQNTLTLDNTTVPDENNTHEIIADTHSFTVTTDSNILKILTGQVEHNTNDNETTSIQIDFSIISKQNTTTIQQQTFQQQVIRSYDPPSIPPQFSSHTTPHNSPKQGSSNMHIVQHVPHTQCQQIMLRTPPYTPAQISNVQPSIFTQNTIHTNPQTHPTLSKTLSGPPLPVIPNNPLSYNLAITNANNVQQPTQSAASLSQPTSLQMISLSTSEVAQNPSTTIRTNPHIYTTNTFPSTGTQNIQHILPTSESYLFYNFFYTTSH